MAFSVLCLASCGKGIPTAPRMVDLGEDFELAPRQQAVVGTTGLRLDFEQVAADSRCPVDVVCVWEGDAEVVVRASQPSRESALLRLHTSGSSGASEARYGDFTVRLVALAPAPRSDRPIDGASYRLTLRVVR